MKIVVIDDEAERALTYVNKLKDLSKGVGSTDAWTVESLNGDNLQEALRVMELRRFVARNGGEDPGNCKLDDYDVLVVDYDLFDLARSDLVPSDQHRWPTPVDTGERIAYLARCYSAVKVIVALNQYEQGSRPVFDLRMIGRLESFADLNIHSSLVADPGLWTGRPSSTEAYFPWHWPILQEHVEILRRREAALLRAMSEETGQVLGLSHVEALTRGQVQPLGHTGLHERVGRLSQGNLGLQNKDIRPWPEGPQGTARLLASRLGKWLHRSVVTPGDVLVDAPHLLARLPGALRSESALPAGGWKQVADLGELLDPALGEARVDGELGEVWYPRGAWRWRDVLEHPRFREWRDAPAASLAGHVFCEDVSTFVSEEHAESFVCDLDTPLRLRYVRQLHNVGYQPESYLYA